MKLRAEPLRDVPLSLDMTSRNAGAAPARGLKFETRQLCRAVGAKRLVDDVSVAVEPGEVLAVVGASGAGKSSFLRLLNRLDEPTGGTVMIDGADYRAIAPPDLRRRVGMVMQTAYLFAGSVAASTATSVSSGLSRSDRSKSSAPGSAN